MDDKENLMASLTAYSKLFADGIAGIGLAHNMLVRELLQQGILDKTKFLESIKECRTGLVAAKTGAQFDAAMQSMAKVVLTSGDNSPPSDWIAKMLPPTEGNG